ncbi:MAG: hypothetical protein HQ564_04255 [Candidatus Saganbacteria bacterium]|nr:hypothetical protein [Candidatus Saganbacteria bacterium]
MSINRAAPIPRSLHLMAVKAAGVNIIKDRGVAPLKKLVAWYSSALPDKKNLIEKAAFHATDQRVKITASLMLQSLNKTGSKGEIQRKLVRLLPKADLHRHLDGSVREEKIIEHAIRQGIDITKDPGVQAFIPDLPSDVVSSPEALRQYTRLYGKDLGEDFLRFLLAGFAIPLAVMQDRIALEDIAYDAIKQAYNNGLLHADLRCAPCLHTENGLTYDEISEAIMQGLLRGEKEFGVSSALVLCIYRDKINTEMFGEKYLDHPEKTALSAVRLAERYPYRIGLDIVGYETPYPPEIFLEAVKLTFGTSVWRTIHAGETPETARNILTAIYKLKANRIGHGVQVFDLTQVEQDGIKRTGVPFEVSVRSNIHLAVLSEKEHPFLKMLRAGFPVTIATDNTTVSDISLPEQIEEISSPFTNSGISDELRRTLNTSITAAFAPKERIVQMKSEAKVSFDLVEFLLKQPTLFQG